MQKAISKWIYLLFWILLLPGYVWAQESASAQQPTRPPFTLKMAPLELINFFQQAITVRADLPFSPHWGIDAGIGLIFNSTSLATYKDESYVGIKVQPALKYYFRQLASGDHSYLSVVYKYHNIHNDRYVNVRRQGGQYDEWMLQRRHRVVQGVALRFGVQQYLGQRKRWMIEPFVGLGARQMRVTDDDLPPDAEALEEGGFFNPDRSPGIYTTPDFLAGFYLGLAWGN